MPVGDDEERAAIWRAERAERLAFRQRLRASLMAPASTGIALRHNWDAVINRTRGDPDDPIHDTPREERNDHESQVANG